MKAFIKSDFTPGRASYEDVKKPEPNVDQVLIRVHAAGICGTDVHVYHSAPFMLPKIKQPVIMGHEASGRVTAIGENVQSVRVGDRIAVESHIWCGNCPACLAGLEHVCPHTTYFGVDVDGVFSEYALLPEKVCRRVPQALGDEEAALLEPFGVAVHAATSGGGVSGKRVLVAGCGPIGLMNIAAAKALGASEVYAIDKNQKRLDVAEDMGADSVIQAKNNDGNDLFSQSDLENIDVAIDYTGQADVIQSLSRCLRVGGSLRLLAIPEKSAGFPYEHIILKGLEVVGVHGRKLFETWDIAEDLLVSGKVNLWPVISHRLSLQDVDAGFEFIAQEEALKILIVPNSTE